jgi:hypothetical protein
MNELPPQNTSAVAFNPTYELPTDSLKSNQILKAFSLQTGKNLTGPTSAYGTEISNTLLERASSRVPAPSPIARVMGERSPEFRDWRAKVENEYQKEIAGLSETASKLTSEELALSGEKRAQAEAGRSTKSFEDQQRELEIKNAKRFASNNKLLSKDAPTVELAAEGERLSNEYLTARKQSKEILEGSNPMAIFDYARTMSMQLDNDNTIDGTRKYLSQIYGGAIPPALEVTLDAVKNDKSEAWMDNLKARTVGLLQKINTKPKAEVLKEFNIRLGKKAERNYGMGPDAADEGWVAYKESIKKGPVDNIGSAKKDKLPRKPGESYSDYLRRTR